MAIEIVPYRSVWPAQFDAISADLRKALGPLAPRIDHIGSTAVPGLAAKDRIDVQVGVHDLQASLAEIRRWLVERDYRPSEVAEDHIPFGLAREPGEWAKAFFQTPAGRGPVGNIHVREVGRRNWRYALLFRDFLRSHPLAVKRTRS